MRGWQLATLIFLGYVILVATLPRGLRGRRRRRAVAGALVGAAVVVLSRALPERGLANEWVLPPILLLIAYWTSGLLFVAPMPRVERVLARLDGSLRVRAVAARVPRTLAELLELAYTGVYPLIPLALYLGIRYGVSPARFWTTILVTDYVCFGMLPWIQTRPPRALGFRTPWRARWRAVNQRIVSAGSVQVNTFPSGHPAEALAAALLLIDAPGVVVAGMFVAAALISAGAVLGRYHYAADAVAGWAVALLVWRLV